MIRRYIPESIKKRYRFIRARLLNIGLARSGTFDQPEDEVEASRDMSVIVPILDSPKFLIRCLHSLELYAPHAEIILVDDGSIMQETLHILEDFHHRNNWLLIRHDKSVGHSRACEDGARLATRPYLCLLNSDTVVTPWSWSAAKRAFETDPRIAVTVHRQNVSATTGMIARYLPLPKNISRRRSIQNWSTCLRLVDSHSLSEEKYGRNLGGSTRSYQITGTRRNYAYVFRNLDGGLSGH